MELLQRRLPIESDLQAFLAACSYSFVALGGQCMQAATELIDLSERLRQAGAGCGEPLLARIAVTGVQLSVEWGEPPTGSRLLLAEGRQKQPSPPDLKELRASLAAAFEVDDPEALRQRNQRMRDRFRVQQEQMESQLEAIQVALERRQQALTQSMLDAETDALTGVYNRRAFDNQAPRAYFRTLRQGTESLSLLLIDLDNFKAVNDTHGHRWGDDYLRWAAQTMESLIRDDVDALYRIGGDEFAIVLFSDAAAACLKAVRLLQALEQRVSIGVVTLERGAQVGPEETFERFQERADQALYDAKDAGRGRIAHADCLRRAQGACRELCVELSSGDASC